MKVAICFSGFIRTFTECFPSYEEYFKDYETYLFAASPPNDTLHKYNFKKIIMQEDEPIEEYDYVHHKRPETLVQNTLRQFYFIELCNNLRRDYEREKNIKFDIIVRTRLDNKIVAPLPNLNNCDPKKIYIPSGEDHGGINDRFAFGGDHAMNVYSNKINRISEYMQHSGMPFHPETMLKWFLDRDKIEISRFPLVSRLNRGNGELV